MIDADKSPEWVTRQEAEIERARESRLLNIALDALDEIGAVPAGAYGGPRAAKAREAARRIRQQR